MYLTLMRKKLTLKQARQKASEALLKSCSWRYRLMMEGKDAPYEEKHFKHLMAFVKADRALKEAAKKRASRADGR